MGARMDFNYFIRALMDVRSATAISAGPLATAFYTRSLSFAGFLVSVSEVFRDLTILSDVQPSDWSRQIT